jgi:hypothetical protein
MLNLKEVNNSFHVIASGRIMDNSGISQEIRIGYVYDKRRSVAVTPMTYFGFFYKEIDVFYGMALVVELVAEFRRLGGSRNFKEIAL